MGALGAGLVSGTIRQVGCKEHYNSLYCREVTVNAYTTFYKCTIGNSNQNRPVSCSLCQNCSFPDFILRLYALRISNNDNNFRHLYLCVYSYVNIHSWKAELALLADLQRTVYPYKWLPISCRSVADQWKFADQWPTFYHWATQPSTLFTKQYKLVPA